MLRNLFLLVPFLLLVHVTSAVALPPCPTGPSAYFHNCEGTYRWTSGPNSGDRYVGEWRDDKKHGQGTYTFANGEQYVGEWRDNKQHGHGTYTYADGDKYVGDHRDDKAHGQGTYTYANGDKYVGESRDGKKHGQGTHYWSADNEFKGDKYVGEFRDNKQHGQGTYTFADGSTYVGEFRDDYPNGRGVTSTSFFTYVGNHKNGKPIGVGTLIFPDDSDEVVFGRTGGLQIDGNFEGISEVIFTGNFNLYWANGDVWVGRITKAEDGKESFSGNKYTAGNVPPEVYAARGGDAPPSNRSEPPRQQTQRPDSDEIIPASSGSGFVVSKAGHIVTNDHVIAGCNQVQVHHQGSSMPAKILARDPVNDLAVVQVEFTPTAIFPISNSNAELLQDIYVAGFPFGYGYSTTIKVTKGVVSSLAGLRNNYSELQIDAALQAGNSGGPILDEAGNVVGVAVAKLDSDWALENFGSVPDDINFGIKSSVLKSFLEANGIETLKASTKSISRTELGKKITDGTLFLSCLMTYAQIEKLRAEKVMFSDLD